MKNILYTIILSFLFSYSYSNHDVGPLVHDQLFQRYLENNVDPICHESELSDVDIDRQNKRYYKLYEEQDIAVEKKDFVRFDEIKREFNELRNEDFNEIKLCLEKYFLFHGNTIQPSIIKEFYVSLADSGDQIISINLSDSASSNRYFPDDSFGVRIITNYDDLRKIISKGILVESNPEHKECESCYFSYTHLGTTDNGAIILEVVDYGGGSTYFGEFLGLKVKERMGTDFVYGIPSLTFDSQQIVLEKLFSIGVPHHISKNINYSGVSGINGNFIILNGTKIEIPSHE